MFNLNYNQDKMLETGKKPGIFFSLLSDQSILEFLEEFVSQAFLWVHLK